MNNASTRSYARPARYQPHLVARLLVLVLLIVFFEGALRKWVVPNSTLIWMALRDGVVFYAIALGVSRGWFLKGWQEGVMVGWTILVTLWAGLQAVGEKQNILVAIVGLRSWLFYMWFAWLCARTLSRNDVEWILKIIALTVVPFAALAIVQHLLPPDHILNRQAGGGDVKDVFMAGSAVRTTGTFPFTSGFVAYVMFVSPIALTALMDQISIRPAAFRWAIFIAWAASILVSGARHSIIAAGLMLCGFLFALLIRRRVRSGKNNGFFAIALFAGTIVALPIAVPSAIEANRTRFETAARDESMSDRIVTSVFGSAETWENLPLLGRGIGLGNNAAGPLSGGTMSFLLAEDETARTLLEAGALGFAFLVLKLIVSATGLFRAFVMLRKTGDVIPWLLWLCVVLQIPAPMLGQLTAHAFAWLTLALAWASLNPARQTAVQPRSVQPVLRRALAR